MPTTVTRTALCLAAAFVAGCGSDSGPAAPPASTFSANAGPEATPAGVEEASAVLSQLDGSGVEGTVTFREVEDALRIRVRLTGVPAGEHGFHVHEGESCAPDSTGTPGGAAGGHLNPLVSPHGPPSAEPTDRHAGDLGNVTAGPDGVAAGVVVDSVLALTGPTSVVGHAVVVHAAADDLTSQPGGAAGARIACGVVREGGLSVEADSTGATPPETDGP